MTPNADFIGECIAEMATEKGISFSLQGMPLQNEITFSPDGAMGLFCRIAEGVSQEVSDAAIKVKYISDPEALLNVTVEFGDGVSHPEVLLYLWDAVEGYAEDKDHGSPIPLDPLIAASANRAVPLHAGIRALR